MLIVPIHTEDISQMLAGVRGTIVASTTKEEGLHNLTCVFISVCGQIFV